MSDGQTLRHATADDLSRILDIYSHYCLNAVVTFEEKPPSIETMAARMQAIAGQQLPYLVATDSEGVVLGYAYASQYRAERTAYAHTVEASIYVQHDKLRFGVGQLLMTELLTHLHTLGRIREVLAVVPEDTTGVGRGVEHFYHKNGFRRVGLLENVGKKVSPSVDCVVRVHGEFELD